MKKILETLKLKWSEYLLEIVVIIIGILGAFALNSWNSNRLDNKYEQELLINIIEDLSTDYQAMFNLLEKVKLRQEIHLRLYNESVSEGFNEEGKTFTSEIVETTDVLIIAWDNHKGSIEKISDREIRSNLNRYFTQYRILIKYSESLNEIIYKQFRPYLFNKEIVNRIAVFESNPYRDDINRSEFFLSDRLVDEFRTKEFYIIIMKLFLGTQDVIESLQKLLDENQLLRSDLETNLN